MHETQLDTRNVTLLDLLDRLLETGVVVDGEIDLAVADINLVHLGLKLVLASSATLEQRNLCSATPISDLPLFPDAEPRPEEDVSPPLTAEPKLVSEPLPQREPLAAPFRPSMESSHNTSAISHDRRRPLPLRKEHPEFDPAKVEHGLAKLALTLVELIRRLMERQAVRRMEHGTLSDLQVERLGEAFRRLENKMIELKHSFGLDGEDLNLDLGPLGNLM